jgi:hypothetical protein
MAKSKRTDRTLRASLCEIERGLFHARYRRAARGMDSTGLASMMLNLPDYQVAATALEAKRTIEDNAYLLGFETVLWEDALPSPTAECGAVTAAWDLLPEQLTATWSA